MRITLDVPTSRATLDAALEGLVRVNVALLGRSQLPPLYRSGVRYRREAVGAERWQTAEQVYSARVGDCEDLACWRAGELRRAGERRAVAFAARAGAHTWHVRVRRADGRIEDPSAVLGMEAP